MSLTPFSKEKKPSTTIEVEKAISLPLSSYLHYVGGRRKELEGDAGRKRGRRERRVIPYLFPPLSQKLNPRSVATPLRKKSWIEVRTFFSDGTGNYPSKMAARSFFRFMSPYPRPGQANVYFTFH